MIRKLNLTDNAIIKKIEQAIKVHQKQLASDLKADIAMANKAIKAMKNKKYVQALEYVNNTDASGLDYELMEIFLEIEDRTYD